MTRLRVSASLGLTILLALVAWPSRAQRGDREAPARYAHLVARAGGRMPWLYSNLRYESNNRSMRGAFDPRAEAGCDNARRQRAIAARTRGLMVLRDAIFSQPDHPVEHRACAIMLPANWITAAVADTAAGVALRPVRAPALEDDAAWAGLESAAAMFGSFPPSARLYETARRPRAGLSANDRAQTENARANVRALAAEAQHLIDAAPRGARAIAHAGAERISASDRAYFTDDVRRDHVIVLGVENPNEHELRDEGKGVAIWGRAVNDDVLTLVRDCVYARRLRDGDVAIERYDLNEVAERRRAIAVLEALVPAGSSGHRVFLWVGGGLVPGTERARDASSLLPTFQRELAAARVAHERVIVFNRPSFRIRGRTPADLAREADRFARVGLPLSVNMSPAALARAIDP